MLYEAAQMTREGEADAFVCVYCDAVSPDAAELLGEAPGSSACGVFLEAGGANGHVLRENDRDIESVCALLCTRKSLA